MGTNALIPVSEPIDLNKSWPSSYADGGRVVWNKATADVTGHLDVSFPDIRQVDITSLIHDFLVVLPRG